MPLLKSQLSVVRTLLDFIGAQSLRKSLMRFPENSGCVSYILFYRHAKTARKRFNTFCFIEQ